MDPFLQLRYPGSFLEFAVHFFHLIQTHTGTPCCIKVRLPANTLDGRKTARWALSLWGVSREFEIRILVQHLWLHDCLFLGECQKFKKKKKGVMTYAISWLYLASFNFIAGRQVFDIQGTCAIRSPIHSLRIWAWAAAISAKRLRWTF